MPRQSFKPAAQESFIPVSRRLLKNPECAVAWATVICAAVKRNDINFIRCIAKRNPELFIIQAGDDGETALHTAARLCNKPIAEIIISSCPDTVLRGTKWGSFPEELVGLDLPVVDHDAAKKMRTFMLQQHACATSKKRSRILQQKLDHRPAA